MKLNNVHKLALLAIGFLPAFTINAGHHEENKDKKVVKELKDKIKTCPDFLNADFKVLHSDTQGNICKHYKAKPILIVNTASHCGYTKQFKGLEKLHQKYKDKGLQVYGFASNSFNQAAKSEKEAASICYKNFGVSFNMFAMTSVKGEDANAVFKNLNQKAGEPRWNFNKYLVMPDGTVKRYDSKVAPLGSVLEKDIEGSIANAS